MDQHSHRVCLASELLILEYGWKLDDIWASRKIPSTECICLRCPQKATAYFLWHTLNGWSQENNVLPLLQLIPVGIDDTYFRVAMNQQEARHVISWRLVANCIASSTDLWAAILFLQFTRTSLHFIGIWNLR